MFEEECKGEEGNSGGDVVLEERERRARGKVATAAEKLLKKRNARSGKRGARATRGEKVFRKSGRKE